MAERGDEAKPTGTLQVRKLTFGSKEASSSRSGILAVTAAASTAGALPSAPDEPIVTGQQGLPSLLKKLRQDAQEEIHRATAHVRQIISIMAHEIQLVEGERDSISATCEASFACLLEDVRELEGQRETLMREKLDLETAKASLESRNAAFTKEMAEVQAEAQRARERADAMEAASVFLQPSDDGTALDVREHADSLFGEADGDRVGSRSLNGSVSLANVPAMHGGCAFDPLEDSTVIGGEGAALRIESKVVGPPGGATYELGARSRATSNTIFGRPPPKRAAGGSGVQETGLSIQSAAGGDGFVRGAVTRNFSFTRKAGRNIVRSLSFGAEPKREWDDGRRSERR